MVTVAEAEALTQSWQDKIIPSSQARSLTNRFILEHLRDGFCAGAPRYVIVQSEPAWAVSILLSRPEQQPREVGEVLIHAVQAHLLGFTPPAEVYRSAKTDPA